VIGFSIQRGESTLTESSGCSTQLMQLKELAASVNRRRSGADPATGSAD
jgi:hypothetical protein